MRDAAYDAFDGMTRSETDVTLHAVRSVLSDADETAQAPAQHATQQAQLDRIAETPADTDVGRTRPAQAAGSRSLRNRITQYRPTRRHIFWAVTAGIVVLRPHWVLLGLLLSGFVTIGAFLCFGADRVWAKLMVVFQSYARRNPERATRLSARLDRFALRWDTFLDRFPDGSVDGLYLPDFQSIQHGDEAHSAAMNARLARMQNESQL